MNHQSYISIHLEESQQFFISFEEKIVDSRDVIGYYQFVKGRGELMDDTTFGKKLRELRTNAGKTVPEVSEYLRSIGFKAATQTIYGWERGHSQPTIDTFMAMCVFYGLTEVLPIFGYKNSSSEVDSPIDGQIDAKKAPSTAEAAPGEDCMISLYRELNREGQKKLLDYADDLVSSGKYTKNDNA